MTADDLVRCSCPNLSNVSLIAISPNFVMMTCRLNGMFSIGEDFDDEDLLGTDWEVRPASGPVDVAASVSSCALRAVSSVAARKEPEQKNDSLQQTVESVLAPCNGAASTNRTHYPAAVKTGSRGLQQISSSSVTRPPIQNHSGPSSLASGHTRQSVAIATEGRAMPSKAPDDFDEWDVDLADLDECDRQVGQPFLHRQTPTRTLCAPTDYPAPSAKTLRPPIGGGLQTRPHHHSLRELSTPQQVFGPSSLNLAAPSPFATPLSSPIPRPSLRSAGPHSPVVFPGFTATLPAPSPISSIHTPRQAQPPRPWATPGQTPQARGLFETVSPAPSSSTMSPYHAHHTPVLTNRLVQLMSASNKFPTNKRPRSEGNRPMTRRFPGPAGRLPQQPQGQIRDEIVVSVPTTPAHGTVARSPSQVAGSQSDEDDFNGGAWAAMKAEMGLDERNPSCFLHSYSVVMVLRKAALKQLSRNKVPNMAVQLKSIIHTHADAKAVFKDPTGEIQGTVHRRLLEDRVDELKVGAVLLLKQVGVFSPSHRNHYLNVTTNNLLRIYSHDGVSLSTTPLPPLILEPMLPSPAPSRGVPREPVSRMHLLFDEEEEEEGQEQGQDLQTPVNTRASSRGPAGNPGPQDAGWDADDDLDELLGELPEDTYSL